MWVTPYTETLSLEKVGKVLLSKRSDKKVITNDNIVTNSPYIGLSRKVFPKIIM